MIIAAFDRATLNNFEYPLTIPKNQPTDV
ncbi:TPA: hypothetical protein ANIA_11451 [Aspergillus nidulans FGSC A4]|uniref:Uncharacterized protein n=1 Tax=Emericella nidulans (strain FGSC A4 / ATCC 38163 / CBS 112.46 / NRRL 194 / M139) TaxID=227321 RepID=C8V9E0_EMENI|nr:TPA: hypothetical protein ANIA_11451 [Aspergillus nidulans FGSC A4]